MAVSSKKSTKATTRKTAAKTTKAAKATKAKVKVKATKAVKAAPKTTTKAKTAAKAKATSTAVKKKAVAKTAAAPAKKANTTAIKERYNKTQILTEVADSTNLSKKQVSDVLDSLGNLIERHVKKRAVGEFALPGLFKIVTVRKPSTKARKGINPFTGEETVFKAKPARTVVKVRPLKKLKEMAE